MNPHPLRLLGVLLTLLFSTLFAGQEACAAVPLGVNPHEAQSLSDCETWTCTTYTTLTHLPNPDGRKGESFGSGVFLSADGDTAMVDGAGKIYIYVKAADAWSITPAAVLEDPQNGRLWGSDISADGATILALTSNAQAPVGEVYIYQKANGVWPTHPTAVIHNTDPDISTDGICGFGCGGALSADGRVALIINLNTTVNGTHGVGKVYLYTKSVDAWSSTPTQVFVNPNIVSYASPYLGYSISETEFGQGLALSADGGTVLIGAPESVWPDFTSPPKVYVYTASNGIWPAMPTAVLQIPILSDHYVPYGFSMTLSPAGDVALIGDQGSNAAFLFTQQNNVWTSAPTAIFTVPDSSFGAPVALSADGTTILVGATTATSNGFTESGKAYLYVKNNGVWPTTPNAVLADPVASCAERAGNYVDAFGSSVALSADGQTAIIGSPQPSNLSLPYPNNTPTTGGLGHAWLYENTNHWGPDSGTDPPGSDIPNDANCPDPPVLGPGPITIVPRPGGSGGLGWLGILALLTGLVVKRSGKRDCNITTNS